MVSDKKKQFLEFLILFSHEMLVVLPSKVDGLPILLKKLCQNSAMFKEILTSDQYFETKVILKMPKFHLGGVSIQLKSKLQKMGLTSIFELQSADLSGMTGDKSLFVSDVYHQAVIDVGLLLLLLF